MFDSLYGKIEETLIQKFADVALLACDVDGVFSDGRLYIGNDGEELKAFHTLDGYGVKALQSIGVDVAVITGRTSNIVTQRMSSLGVKHIIQGEHDKKSALKNLQSTLSLNQGQVASIGDDVPDIGMFDVSGLCLSVPNGHPLVKQAAHYTTQSSGGFGAVREVCDLILQAKNKLHEVQSSSV